MIIIDILEPPAFKNIAHVGSFKHFVFVYLRILHLMGMSYLISLNPMLFKNIAHVGSFKHFRMQRRRLAAEVPLQQNKG